LSRPAASSSLPALPASSTGAAPARFLYTGDLFRASVKWAESWDLPWVVLSAAHGIVGPDQVLAPYDVSLISQALRTDRLIARAAQQLPISPAGCAIRTLI